MQNLLYKTKEHELVGKKIEIDYLRGDTPIPYDEGIILRVLPANVEPDEETIMFFYGKNCPSQLKKSLKYDRVMFKSLMSGHTIVYPLNPEPKYSKYIIKD